VSKLQNRRTNRAEAAISKVMQELIQENYSGIGPVAVAFQTLRSRPLILNRLMKHIEKQGA
jgi:hypothetical protein